MEIVAAKSLPSILEVAEISKREFSGRYSYELFPEEKSVFLSRSTSVKVQIFVHENQIFVQAFSQSLFEAIIVNICMSELGLILILFLYHKGTQLLSQRAAPEKELSLFLEHTYNHQQSRIEQSKKNYP